MADHAKQTKLSLVVDGLSRKTASHKVNEWVRCSRVEFQKIDQGILVVLVNHIDFKIAQDQASIAREQYWHCIQFFNPNRSSRVAPISPSNTSEQDCTKFFLVRQVSICRSDQTDMLSTF